MTRKPLITLSCAAFLLGGCKQYAYYQSPFHGSTSSYKSMPLASEKHVSETQVSGALITGAAGDKWRDGYWAVNGNLYRSHSTGMLRAFYGLSTTAGAYRVRKIGNDPSEGDKYPNDSLISARSGSKFFGGIGGSAGLYLATPFNDGGEWRVVGVESNYMHEFGHYWSFRNKLPDTAANLVSRPRGFMTLGIHTDVIFRTRRGTDGFKMGGVFSTKPLTLYEYDGQPSTITPGYFSITYHYTRERTTSFWQVNFGTYTANLMMGISYRL